MPIIYLDILVIINWLIDYVLLHTTAFLLHLPYRHTRMVLGAAIGGLSACSILLDMPSGAGAAVNAGMALLICLVAFSWKGAKQLLYNGCVFFIVSAGFAGIVAAVWFWIAPDGFIVIRGVVYYDIPVAVLILLVALTYLLMRVVEQLMRRKIPTEHLYPMRIVRNGTQVELSAMFDTGASPVDVFSGKPVIVAERQFLLPILPDHFPPPGVRDIALGVRLIPIGTLSGQTLLPAFAADDVYIGECKVGSVYVAVVETLDKAHCQALFGRDLGDQIKERRI